MHCEQSGHLARNLPTTKACGTLIDFSSLLPESSKNKIVVLPVFRRMIASLSPRNPY